MTARLSRVSVLALLAMAPGAGMAADASACTPSSVTGGETVTCSGSGTGLLAGSADGVTVTVDATGAITAGAGDNAFSFDDDLTLTNTGTITAADDHAIDADKRATVTNTGTITSEDGDALHLGDDAVVLNTGTLDGEDEGIQVDDDATITNSGTILSGDKGIQAGDGATITNTGTISAGTEGIEAGDDAVIVNTGTITSDDDAINAGENAYITNSGDLLVTGDQDGIDIDSGTVINYGTIIAYGGEDGIDFDASEVETSTITNYGLIEGKIGINVELGTDDEANTMSQVVINYGTIIGHSGTALQLGAGDDTLELYSLDIQGTVDLGEGEDVLIVHSTVQTGTVTFVSDPETIDLSDAPATALYGNNTLVVASAMPFAGGDALIGRAGLALGKSVLDAVPATPAAPAALAFAPGGADGGWWATGSGAVFDGDSAARLTLGRDGESFGVFLSQGRAKAETSDDHHLTDTDTLLGLRLTRDLAGGSLSAMAYLGFGTSEIASATSLTGDGSADTRSFGLAAAWTSAPRANGLSFTARAGAERKRTDAFTVSGLGGASFAERDVTTGYLSAEARLVRPLAAGTLTPFLGVDVIFTDGEDVTMTLGSGAATFGTGGEDSFAQMTFGAEFTSATAPWTLRLEGQLDEDGNTGALLAAGLRF